MAAVMLLAGPPLAAGPAGAEPFTMWPIPKEIPEAIDGAIPPPPFPRLQKIPPRAQTPGTSHRFQELREAVMPDPTGDPFFDRWAPDLDRRAPGELLAIRDVTWPAGLLVTTPISRARQVKFATTDAAGRASFGTATILEPRTGWTGSGPRPILVNNLPIDSLGAACTPGMTLAHGMSVATGATDFIPPTTQLALARGYTVIVPDHQGPRQAYAEPVTAGHIVLDSVRAAAHLDAKRFGSSPVAMTGYSGGAIATNGAAKLLGTYAPELEPRMVGAALGGVPADFRLLVGSMNANLATGLFHAATFGIARERPEILTLANNPAQWLATSPLKNVCIVPAAMAGPTFLPMQLLANDPDPFHSPIAEEIYRATKMSDKKAQVPLYIYNGAQEFWIPALGARNLYREQCRLGANAVYREPFGEHAIAMLTGYPEALSWLDARLQGNPAVSECPR
ncbi:putative lipase [Gordonia hirsuta DSM 44140 = NBRC 16056]|uniref:Putative lipase n=1 Tax=Gordonia hirsuta DSM 44140 = NBRC 16056 TaxID=1121927 RepID=L7LF25_9ACTN|nr:putative lipase [Gordonia hirsuta DSM 44140 = NBRC 16056]